MRTRQEIPAFFYREGSYEGILKSGIEVKVSSEGFWQNVQQLHGAKIHIFDNDTSGEIRSIWMTVRYRCGQSNELPPVWIFYYLLMRDRSMGSCLSWADKVLPILLGKR